MAGQYFDSAGDCSYCPDGKSSLSSTTADPVTSCTQCSLGYESNAGTSHLCMQCTAANTFNDAFMGQADCYPCPIGSFNTAGGTFCHCNAGKHQVGTVTTNCVDCPIGTYQDQTGKDFCIDCPKGKYQGDQGKTSCIDCEVGKYQDTPGKGSCIQCSPGTYQNAIGQDTCIGCSVGSSQGDYEKTICPLCDLHTYQNKTNQTSCIACPQYTYLPHLGGTVCLNCPSGQYSNQSEAPYCFRCHDLCKECTGPTNYECSECTPGVLHATPWADYGCDCVEGYYYESTGSSLANYCQVCDIFCTKCNITSSNCSRCIDNPGVLMINNNFCSCSATSYFVYLNMTTSKNECVKCHSLCVDCNGPFATQCSNCDLSKDAVFVAPSTCKCKSRYYYSASADTCLACNPLCAECYGPLSTECYSCDTSVGYSVEDQANTCVTDCDQLQWYYRSGRACMCMLRSLIVGDSVQW